MYRLGSYGQPLYPLVGAPPVAPLLTAAFSLMCEGVPQQFPAPSQEQRLSGGNTGFALQVQMLDQNGNPLNIAAATGLELMVTWPGGQIQVIPAELVTNGTDGLIGAAIPGGLGGGYGLYWISAIASFPNQILRASGGRLWYGWLCQ
jgi:hypothetical protein